MANVGTAAAGMTLVGAGNGVSPTFVAIGTNSGLSNHGVVIAKGTSAFVATSTGNTGYVLTSNGASSDPSFQAISVSGAVTSLAMQTGTSPVTPLSGVITLNGGVVAAGTNPIRTNGTGANTAAVQVQISQAIASTDATKIGLCNFSSSNFSVDANGFVTATSGETWTDISGTTGLTANNNYFVTAASTLTLPASPSQGNRIKIIVDTASSVVITANTGQTIRLSTGVSSSAGTQTNTARGDAMTIVYRSTGTVWIAEDFVGSWTPA